MAKSKTELELRYIPLEDLILLDDNPKLHDIGAISSSIIENGFRDPPIWDASLNNGKGGIVAGNGRSEALALMKSQGQSAPRGIAVDAAGNWLVPVIFGCDARSEAAAKRFAIDHNNLVMAGGDFTAIDMVRLWDKEGYTALLKELAEESELPLTVDGDDLDLMLQLAEKDYQGQPEEEDTSEEPEFSSGSDTVMFVLGEVRFSVPKQDYVSWFDAINLRCSFDAKKIAEHVKELLGV